MIDLCSEKLVLTATELAVQQSCDKLFVALNEYYRVRTTESLVDLIQACKNVEALHFSPVLIRKRHAVQITSKDVTWVIPPKEVACQPTS